MKYVKILGLAVVAAMALMAFVGAATASATVLCSTTTTPCNSKYPVGTKLDWSLTPNTSALLKETGVSGETLDTCKKSTVTGDITDAGSATTTVKGNITKLDWEECTFPTKTVEGFFGGLEVHHITGTSNGTVTSSAEIRVTINTIFFGSCVYGVVGATDLGTLKEGNPSVFEANAVAKKLTGSSITCPETSLWSASYTQTADPTLTTLSVEPS